VTDWRKLVGHRVLVKERSYFLSDNIIEVVVVEVSPSGKYVKLRFGDRDLWVPADEYEVVEDLEAGVSIAFLSREVSSSG